jgi:hypothetical protein
MLDDDLLAFVRGSIRSIWALELLMLMSKQTPAALTADELVRKLRASPTLVAICLEQLEKGGLIASDQGAWRYAPTTPTLQALSDKLQLAYAERPVTVINAIVGSPNERLKSFADAFRFPKKDN